MRIIRKNFANIIKFSYQQPAISKIGTLFFLSFYKPDFSAKIVFKFYVVERSFQK
jgi:hypothetical protein